MSTPPFDMAALQALYAALPAPPPPIPVAADAALRDGLAGHLRTELKRRTYHLPGAIGGGFGLSEFDIADLVIAFLRPCACYPNPADHETGCPQHAAPGESA